jgi:predicted transcriptional regulator
MTEIDALYDDAKESDLKDSTREVLQKWKTLRRTNTHSDKTRAHGLDNIINMDAEGEELVQEATEYLNIAEKTTRNWISKFESEGLITEENGDYSATAEGRVVEEGLNRYSMWLAENHPVTEERLKEAALDGIFDNFGIRMSASEVDNDEFIKDWKGTKTLHDNVKNEVDTKDAYDEAIMVMNELRGDRTQILSEFLQRPEEEAAQIIDNGDYDSIKTGRGAKTYVKRLVKDREILQPSGEGYELTEKGEKAIEYLEFQSQMLKYSRVAGDIGHFVQRISDTDLVNQYKDNLGDI